MTSKGLSDALRTELDGAIRHGLVEANTRGPLWETVGPILRRIEHVLTTETPNVDEVVEAMKRDGGFMRIGMTEALINDKVVGSDILISAQAQLAREQAEGSA